MYDFYQDTKNRCFPKALDMSDSPVIVGDLLYSGNFTDPNATIRLLKEGLSKIGFHEEIGGWVQTPPGIKIPNDMWNNHSKNGGAWWNQTWCQLIIEVDKRYKWEAKRALIQLMNKTDDRLGGMHYRFTPAKSLCTMSPGGAAKHKGVMEKHQLAIADFHPIYVQDDLLLDQREEHSGFTLREFIMNLEHSETKAKLFHSVDVNMSYTNESGTELLLTVYPEHQEKASAKASILPSMVHHHLGSACLSWFSQ